MRGNPDVLLDLDALRAKMPNMRPALKVVAITVLLAFKDKANSITFVRQRSKRLQMLYTPEGHGECEMVPPPRYLFPEIMEIFRAMGRHAAKNVESAFGFSYTENGGERKLIWLIDTNNDAKKSEFEALLESEYLRQETKDANKEVQRNHEKRQSVAMWSIISFLVGVIVGTLLAVAFAHLFMP